MFDLVADVDKYPLFVPLCSALRVKSRTGHVRCKAFVGDKLAAEADIKFMLVDAEPL